MRPADPALALIDALLEDYSDEWLTKAMFHYRWAFAADARNAGRLLPNWGGERLSDEMLATRAAFISERQIGRLRYVGSNEITGPVIEASYARFLDAFENHLKAHPFLLGARPGACDFAAFGQLTQLTQVDPTPEAVARERAPRVVAWVSGVEDLSGLEAAEAGWLSADALPETLTAILCEVGRVYAPLLLANAKAAMAGRAEVRAEIDGRPWVQQTYAYQAKCLGWLREEYAALDATARGRADRALAGSGCEALFVGA